MVSLAATEQGAPAAPGIIIPVVFHRCIPFRLERDIIARAHGTGKHGDAVGFHGFQDGCHDGCVAVRWPVCIPDPAEPGRRPSHMCGIKLDRGTRSPGMLTAVFIPLVGHGTG